MGAASNLLTGSTVSGQLAFSALHVATVGRSSGLFSSMGAQGFGHEYCVCQPDLRSVSAALIKKAIYFEASTANIR